MSVLTARLPYCLPLFLIEFEFDQPDTIILWTEFFLHFYQLNSISIFAAFCFFYVLQVCNDLLQKI